MPPPTTKTRANYRHWTMAEIKEAAELWEQGLTIREIADQIGRNAATLSGQIEKHRHLFPRRRSSPTGGDKSAPRKTLHMPVSEYVHTQLRELARKRGTTISAVVRDALRKEIDNPER